MSKPLGILAAASGLVAVVCGAFAAHGLKASLSPAMLATWETAVSYQVYHTLALLILALSPLAATTSGRLAGWLFVAGTAIFSGSLYILVLLGMPWLGMVTPIGGVLLIIGWAALLLAFARRHGSDH